jgi:hypothetical protein
MFPHVVGGQLIPGGITITGVARPLVHEDDEELPAEDQRRVHPFGDEQKSWILDPQYIALMNQTSPGAGGRMVARMAQLKDKPEAYKNPPSGGMQEQFAEPIPLGKK